MTCNRKEGIADAEKAQEAGARDMSLQGNNATSNNLVYNLDAGPEPAGKQ